jgi:hypothetical protein
MPDYKLTCPRQKVKTAMKIHAAAQFAFPSNCATLNKGKISNLNHEQWNYKAVVGRVAMAVRHESF